MKYARKRLSLPETPFAVMTKSGSHARMWLTSVRTCSSLIELNIHLILTLLVLQRAIEDDNPRVHNPPTYYWMRNIFVQHHTAQRPGVLDRASRDLLYPCIAHDVHRRQRLVRTVLRSFNIDCADALQREFARQLEPASGKFSTNGGLDESGFPDRRTGRWGWR